MAWILEARELSPYYFLKRIMFDIYALQSECKKEALAGTKRVPAVELLKLIGKAKHLVLDAESC